MQSLQESNLPQKTKKQVEEVKKIMDNVGTKNEKQADSSALKNHILYLEEKMGILEEENQVLVQQHLEEKKDAETAYKKFKDLQKQLNELQTSKGGIPQDTTDQINYLNNEVEVLKW